MFRDSRVIQVGKLTWHSLNANRDRIYGKFFRLILQPRNPESKWVGVLSKIQNGVYFLPSIVYNIGVNLKIIMFCGKQVVTGTQQSNNDTRKRML